jgi:hypothetical protein
MSSLAVIGLARVLVIRSILKLPPMKADISPRNLAGAASRSILPAAASPRLENLAG